MIAINVQMLTQNGISADEYVFLKLIMDKRYSNLQDVYKLLHIREDVLIRKGYLRRLATDNAKAYVLERFALRDKFKLDFLGDKDGMWKQLVELYPYKVPSPRGGGERVLKAQDPNAHTNLKLKEKYLTAIASDPFMHKRVMNALKVELKQNRNNLGYLQSFSTWINQRSWEKYIDIEDVVSPKLKQESGENYGLDLK